MSEDMKKTIQRPRIPGQMAYNTVVMQRPPEMTVILESRRSEKLGVAEHRDARRSLATASAPTAAPLSPDAKATLAIRKMPSGPSPQMPLGPSPQMPRRRSAPAITHVPGERDRQSPIGALRTRMVSVKAMPTFQNQVGAPQAGGRLPPPPPPQIATLEVSPLAMPAKRRQWIPKAVLFGGAAIVLGVCLVLPASGQSKSTAMIPNVAASASSPLAAIAAIAADSAAAIPPKSDAGLSESPVAAEVIAAPAATSPRAETSATEEQAGAMLLAGRRSDALALYRELANSSQTTRGIEAMVEVLSQKVAPR